MYLIIDGEGRRLCQDKRFRSFANYGTFPECVKEYNAIGWAIRVARRLRCCVVKLPQGSVEIDSSGEVIVREPCVDNPNHEKVTRHKLLEFISYDGRQQSA